MSRRCVVCGKQLADNATDCAYYYPRNEKEARIWQQSMGACLTPLEDIQKCCCVCIEHIPQFVERAQKQAALIKDKYDEEKSLKSLTAQSSGMSQPSLNVLLLPGAATLPSGCEKSCESDQSEEEDSLDEEIFVRESSYANCGAHFAEIDETEVTVLRTPMHNDEELQKLAGKEQCGDNNCTDVLVLGHNLDKCPCKCKQCSKTTLSPYDPPCIPPKPQPQINYTLPSDTPSPELHEIIEQQQQRISELESLLCRQNEWHLSLQHKMDDLYTEFGRLEPIEPYYSQQEQPQQQSSNLRNTSGGSGQWYPQRSLARRRSEQAITNNSLNGRESTTVLKPKPSNDKL